jgi:hypothetical protein
MPEEEESNRPKLIIPASEGDKSKSRLLVPQADSEIEPASLKPQLAIDHSEEPQVQETPVEETPVEETPVEETPVEETPVEETPVEETPVEETVQDSVNVVEMSPPVNDEGVIGQLPQPQEDDWMKAAYEQVADADRATEVMNDSVSENSLAQSNVDQSAEPVYQAPAEPVYEAPVEAPLMPPQVVATPQMYAQQQLNPYQNVQPYQQSYYASPVAGTYPYQQQGMPANVPPNNQQVPVGQPRGIPGPAWLTIGLIVGVALALLIFKYMPLDMASGFRPDLVKKGKNLVINANMPPQNQTGASVAPPVPQPEEVPSDPEEVPSDPEEVPSDPEEVPSDPEEATDSDVDSDSE